MAEKTVEVAQTKKLDMNDKVNVRNCHSIELWVNLTERTGSQKITGRNTALFTVGEILQQKYNDNVNFVGINGQGDHASAYIMDRDVRIECGFESADGKRVQLIVDEKAIIDMFNIDRIDTFYENLQSKVITLAEKQTLRECINTGKVNSHDKIELCKKYLANQPIELPKRPVSRTKRVTE